MLTGERHITTSTIGERTGGARASSPNIDAAGTVGTGGVAAGARAGSFRPEVQALRAVAVALVVVYHLWPDVLPGGYVGVDVFFVISGFLITGQLLREITRTGRIRLLEFWARRIRRLLPAAFTVLAVVAVGVLALVPQAQWQQFFREIGGSALYVQNWALISDAVNYFASSNGASPVQHFWSLSVEEQFYLLWPLLLLAPMLLPVKASVARTAAFAVLAAGSAASFVYGLWLSGSDPSVAYLSTGTRAWEFGVGGLLAFAANRRRRGAASAVLSWLGLAGIGVAAFALSGDTPFPGTAALLPVGGALVVIAAGLPETGWGPGRLMTGRVVQWLGDVSYSLYLWHWPFIVLVPLALARLIPGYGDAGPIALGLILLASLAAAAASKRLIEDPTRRARALASARPRRSFAITAAAMTVVVAASGAVWGSTQRVIDTSAVRTASFVTTLPPCLGAAALGSSSSQRCSDTALDGVLVPSLVSVRDDLPDTCIVGTRVSTPESCRAGVPAADATTTVALVGDSHAAQWLPALDTLAKQKKWHIVMMLKGSCPYARAERSPDAGSAAVSSCRSWNASVQQRLDAIPNLGMVFTSADVKDRFADAGGSSGYENAVRGYRQAWQELPESVQKVYVLADTPRPSADALDCLERLGHRQRLEPGACGIARSDAIEPDPIAEAARGGGDRVQLLDLTNAFCTSMRCDPVVGHVLVYRDQSHVSATYAATLAPDLAAAVAASLSPG